jgi:hypothetical protein
LLTTKNQGRFSILWRINHGLLKVLSSRFAPIADIPGFKRGLQEGVKAIRPFVSRADFWRLVLPELYSGSTVAERGALVGPIERYAVQQTLDGQGARLAALDDRLGDIGGDISKPRETADMRLSESIGLRNLGAAQ